MTFFTPRYDVEVGPDGSYVIHELDGYPTCKINADLLIGRDFLILKQEGHGPIELQAIGHYFGLCKFVLGPLSP